jgi:RNase adaptor protein for sRNA GlmZ degradation
MTVTITSFGYLHGAPPAAHITLDLRRHFRDPHVNPELRNRTAHDQAVRDIVLTTPGIRDLIDSAIGAVRAYQAGPGGGDVHIAIGCAGGRHRAATVAAELADALGDALGDALADALGDALGDHRQVTLTHRDLDKPVVHR